MPELMLKRLNRAAASPSPDRDDQLLPGRRTNMAVDGQALCPLKRLDRSAGVLPEHTVNRLADPVLVEQQLNHADTLARRALANDRPVHGHHACSFCPT